MARRAIRRDPNRAQMVREYERHYADKHDGDDIPFAASSRRPVEHKITIKRFDGHHITYAFLCTGCWQFGRHHSTEEAAKAEGEKHLAREGGK